MPHKGFRVGIGGRQKGVDCRNQLWNALEATSPNAFFREVSEPPLHEVEPGRTGGREVQVKSRMATQPRLHFDLGMCPVVIQYQVQGNTLRELPVQMTQETQELLVPVSWETLSDHPPVQEIESREECCDPVPLVVMSHGSATAFLHGQPGLSALERLNLALFVHAQDNCLVGRIEIESNNISELLGEVGVLGELEPLGAVGLKPVSVPNPLDGGITNTLSFRHGAGAPVRSTLWFGLGRQAHDLGYTSCIVLRTPSSARLDPGQNVDTSRPETLPPQHHRRAGGSQLLSDTIIGGAISSQQDDPRSKSYTLWGTRRPGPCFEGSPLFTGYNKGSSRIPHANHNRPSRRHCQVICVTID